MIDLLKRHTVFLMMPLFVLISCTQANQPLVLTTLPQALNSTGKMVAFKGIAQNAKLGALVLTKDLGIYCLDKGEWPENLVGHEIKVEGLLELTDEFAAKAAPDGSISQGTLGKDLVIRRCDVKN
jgi:hypothetical protein